MVYPALLPLMRTPQLPVVDWTEAPPNDLNGLVRFELKDEIWFLRVCHHISNGLYQLVLLFVVTCYDKKKKNILATASYK